MVCIEFKDDETGLKDFAESTSLHGARYLAEKNLLRRLFWLVALGVAFGFCGNQVYKTVNAFLAKPFSTTLTVQRNESEMKYFPAVTICNLNMISLKQYILTYRKWGLGQNFSNEQLRYDIMSFMALMSYTGEGNAILDEAKEKLLQHEDFTKRGPLFGESLESFSHTLEGMLSFEWLGPCKWRGQKCSAKNFTSMVTLRMGRCFTFNSGYTEEHPLLENPQIPGPSQGLRLKLNVQEEDHVTNFQSPMAGFKVLIHDQKEFPLIEELGFAIQPGTHTFASVSVTKFKNLASPFKTNCSSPYLPYSNYFGYPYSPEACVKQCLHTYLIKKCQCQPVHNITPGVELCSLKDAFNCVYPTMYRKLPPTVSECSKKCPSPCQLTQYNTKLSYASAISNAFGRTMPIYLEGLTEDEKKSYQFGNMSSEQIQAYLKENLASIDIFFEDFSYTYIQQKPVYDTWALLANVGGYTGLFLGMSFLTVLEFLEFSFILFFNKIRRSSKEAKVSSSENISKIGREQHSCNKSTEVLHMYETDYYQTSTVQ